MQLDQHEHLNPDHTADNVTTRVGTTAPRKHPKKKSATTTRAAAVLQAIATDATRADDKANGKIVSVGPAGPGDPTLLFLRSGGRTCMMIAVPPDVIRSKRLRGGKPWMRNHELEHEWELSRLLDFEDSWNKHIDGIA